jgi:predicted nucleic acid-binding protein
MIVVDASVFCKFFLDEPDRDKSQALFTRAIMTDIPILAPSLLLYETLSVALHNDVPFKKVIDLLTRQRSAGMSLVEPSSAVLEKAHEIATTGHPKSGYPSLQGSIYHGLAIVEGTTFVTADERHFAKAKSFGSISLLTNEPPY